ncbi:MAG: class I SAM-dependent methyltransferase [Dehalococcoidia bacterium]
MSMSWTGLIRKVVKEREAIPTPDAILYNATVARVLRKPEAKIADDVAAKMRSGTVLDLGSGPGYLLIDIARKTTSLTLYGIDLSRQMVKMARRHAKGAGNVQFVLANAARLPFKDDSIDLIISTGTLHHWKAPAEVFHECHRVLKTGSEAWIYDGCPDVFRDRAHRERLKREYGFLIPRMGHGVAQLNGFSRQEYETRIRSMLEQTGFKDNCRMELTDIWMKVTFKKHG